MICPECGGKTHVINSRPVEQAQYRRRECRKCGKRFDTFELPAAVLSPNQMPIRPCDPYASEADQDKVASLLRESGKEMSIQEIRGHMGQGTTMAMAKKVVSTLYAEKRIGRYPNPKNRRRYLYFLEVGNDAD